MVSLVLVSHSSRLIDALAELVADTTGGAVRTFGAGGTEDGRFGTSVDRIRAAIRSALDASTDGCLVLYDTGSAWLTIGVAVDDLTAHDRARLELSDAPLVEGALAAAARASDGAPLSEVVAAAASAFVGEKRPADDAGADIGARLSA